MSGSAGLNVQPLATDRFADLAQLFNEGGDPRWCWCQYFRRQGLEQGLAHPADHASSAECERD